MPSSESFPISSAPVNVEVEIYLPWMRNNQWRMGIYTKCWHAPHGYAWKTWIHGVKKEPRFTDRLPVAWRLHNVALRTNEEMDD